MNYSAFFPSNNYFIIKAVNLWGQAPIYVKFFIGIVVMLIFVAAIDGLLSLLKGPIKERHIAGIRLATCKQLAKKTVYKDKKRRHQQIMLGEVPWPDELENRHLLIAGTTGAGKSTLIRQILPFIRVRNGRAIIVDLNGEFARLFYQPGDRIYNPFDAQSIMWNPLSEIKSITDITALIQAMVPAGSTPEDENWRSFTRDLLKSIMLRLFENGELNMDRLKHYTISAGDKEIAAFLQGGENPNRLQENSMVSTSKSVLKHFVESWDAAPRLYDVPCGT